jgi:hypothetical protein
MGRWQIGQKFEAVTRTESLITVTAGENAISCPQHEISMAAVGRSPSFTVNTSERKFGLSTVIVVVLAPFLVFPTRGFIRAHLFFVPYAVALMFTEVS